MADRAEQGYLAKGIIRRALREMQQSGAATLSPTSSSSGSGQTAASSPGGVSIQDGEGRMRWMWGASRWDGEDVF